jgi:hypothetical protein
MTRRQRKIVDPKPGLPDEACPAAGTEKATAMKRRPAGVPGRHHYEYAPPDSNRLDVNARRPAL